METNQGRDPPTGRNVFFGWCVFCAAAFLGVAFCLPGEDPVRAAIWAAAASAVAGLVLSCWWALGYVAPPSAENENAERKAVLATSWETPFVVGAVLCAVSFFLLAPAYAQGRSPFHWVWCLVGIGGFVAAGIVVGIVRGGREDKRLLVFTVSMLLWTVLMLIGQHAMNTGFERPLIGVLLGAVFFLFLFKPWRKD